MMSEKCFTKTETEKEGANSVKYRWYSIFYINVSGYDEI